MMAIRKLPGRRRGPMSLAQKAALKKAQEASARARRGTGKVELKKRRPTAKDYRAQGDKQAREMGMLDRGGSDSRKLKKAMRGSDITRDATPSRANNPRTKFDRNSGNQTVTRFTPKQRAAGFRKGAGLTAKNPASDMRNAKDVIAKANSNAGSSGVKYEMKPGGRVKTVAGKKWYEVTSVQPNGKRMDYWLTKDQGSTRGAWPDELGPDGFNNPAKKSSSAASAKKPISKSTKFDDLPSREKNLLSSVADTIEKINDDIIGGSKEMRWTAESLYVFDNADDPDAPGNDQDIEDFINGIDEAIYVIDDLWQGSSEEKAARKKLLSLKKKIQSIIK